MRPGPGADVGAPVAADLGLVADATERHAHELTPEGAGDRLAERRSCRHPGGPTRARMVPPPRRPPGSSTPRSRRRLAHGQELDDAVLHLVEAGVVGVEHRPGPVEIEVVVGRSPHGISNTVSSQVRIQLASGLWSPWPFEPVELLAGRDPHLVGQVRSRPAVVGTRPRHPHRRPRRVPAGSPRADAAGWPLAGPGSNSSPTCSSSSASTDASATASVTHSIGQLEPALDVDGLEQLDPPRHRELRPPADRVGQRAGIGQPGRARCPGGDRRDG